LTRTSINLRNKLLGMGGRVEPGHDE